MKTESGDRVQDSNLAALKRDCQATEPNFGNIAKGRFTMFETGKSYVFNIPPGWILTGTVMNRQDGIIQLKNGAYIEGIANGHSALGSITNAKDEKEVLQAVTRCYPLKDGFMIRESNILLASEATIELSCLHKANKRSISRY